jgi:hypothetical protein
MRGAGSGSQRERTGTLYRLRQVPGRTQNACFSRSRGVPVNHELACVSACAPMAGSRMSSICYCWSGGIGLSSPFRISLRRPSRHPPLDGPSCATDKMGALFNGTQFITAGIRARRKSSRRNVFMNANGVFVGLLIGLFAFLLVYWTRRLKLQLVGAGSQRMCPSCGLITSRLKARCMECGKSLLRP